MGVGSSALPAVRLSRRVVDINLEFSENSPMVQRFKDTKAEFYTSDWVPVSPAIPGAKIVSQAALSQDITFDPRSTSGHLTSHWSFSAEVNKDGSAVRATICRWHKCAPNGLFIRIVLDNLESVMSAMEGNVTSLGDRLTADLKSTCNQLAPLLVADQDQKQKLTLVTMQNQQQQKRIAELTEQVEHVTSMNEQLSDQMRLVTAESQQLKGKVALVTDQNEQQQRQSAEVSGQVEHVTTLNQQLTNQVQVVTAESQQLKQEVANLAFELDQFRAAMQRAVQPVPAGPQIDTAAAEWLHANKFSSVADAQEWVQGSCYDRISPALMPLGVSSADDMLLLQPDMVAELSSIPPVFRKKLTAVLKHAVTAKDQVEVVFGRHLQWMSNSLGATNADEVISQVTRADLQSVLPASSLTELEQTALIAAVSDITQHT